LPNGLLDGNKAPELTRHKVIGVGRRARVESLCAKDRQALEGITLDCWAVQSLSAKSWCVACQASTVNAKLERGFPAVARIVFRHRLSDLHSLFARVLLEGDVILANEERHDSGIAVFGGISHNGKPAGDLSVHEKIFRAI